MLKIKMLANLSYETARMNAKKDYEEFISKNNNADNSSYKQKSAIIVNNDISKDKKLLSANTLNNSSINKLLLNSNVRNDDGLLHLINVTLYVDEDNVNEKDSEYIYNTYFVNNIFSNGMFKNVSALNATLKIEEITKIDCLKDCNSYNINTKSIGRLLEIDDIGSDMYCIDTISKVKLDNCCSSVDEYYAKHKKELDDNIELKNEVERIFKTKGIYAINYASYYFDNKNIYNNNIKLLVEALYIAKRIKVNEYYEMHLIVKMYNFYNKFLFFTKLLSLTGGLFIHFNIDFTDYVPEVYPNGTIDKCMEGDAFKNVISEISKNQYGTICSFYIDLEESKNKSFIIDILYRMFKIVSFYNELNVKQAIDYARTKLNNSGLTNIENRVINIVKEECDRNDDGLCKSEVDEIITDVKKRVASSIYEKEYISDDIDLNKIIGLSEFKKEMERIKNSIELSYVNDKLSFKQTNKAIFNMNYRFVGDVGVGKTYSATFLAKYLYHARIITSNSIIKIYSIKDALELFDNLKTGNVKDGINEYLDNDTYDVLLIENIGNTKPEELSKFLSKLNELKEHNLVILSGSEKEFNKLDNSVAIFKSKFPKTIKFERYTTNELIEILIQKLKDKNYEISESAINKVYNQFEKVKKTPNFSNATFVENYAENIINNLLNRKFSNSVENVLDDNSYLIKDFDVENVDLVSLIGNDYKTIETYEKAMDELDNLIGLTTVKSYVKSYIAKSKIDKLKKEYGYIGDEGLNMHLCFTGNPGTAKTTVARQFAKILYINGIITKPEIVECGLSDLQGEYLGQTSPKVIQKFEEAKGGVIFIDEAYSLNNDDVYSKQTIDTIVEQMENHRDEVIVIFAGYRDKMEEFIKSNPGIKGRVSRFLEFPNYNINELMQIFDKMINDKKYMLENAESIKMYVRKYLEEKMMKEDFANGREVRLLIENAILNQSMRLYEYNYENIKDKNVLMTLKYEDFVDESKDFYKEKNKIGFVA